MTAWIFLSLAIGFEVAGTLLLKLSNGFENWIWGSAAIACYSVCFWMLAPAMKEIPVGIVYAIWAGVGIVAATSIGYFFFKEYLTTIQFIFILMILVGAVGLRLSTGN